MSNIFWHILTGYCFFVLGWHMRGIKEALFKAKMNKLLDECFEGLKDENNRDKSRQ